MEFTNLLFLFQRDDWRAWLAENHRSAKEAWLVYPKAHTGKPRIAYNQAVEEALCFGWIDSTNKTLDADHLAQRFTPRNPKSAYSQTNIERLRRLLAQNKVAAQLVPEARQVASQQFDFPADLMATLQANPAAWENFQRFSPAYQRIRIAYIDHARNRPQEFKKRLNHFLKMTEQGKQFGYRIEDFY
jgi:uncharacterized protein YdeI (YjbR/CyaY-like superfamily)